MKIEGHVGFHNKFDIVLKSAVTGEIKQQTTAYNVVLDRYYDRLKSMAHPWTDGVSICVGTGTGTPTSTDTDLFSFLDIGGAARGNVVSVQNHKKYSNTLTVTFSETQANGVITEVGICLGYYAWNHYILTHALLQDEHGQTTTIDKTNTDVLIITATLYAEITLPNWIKPFPLRTDGRYYLCTNFDDVPSVSFVNAPPIIRRVFLDIDIEYSNSGNQGGWSFGLCKNCGQSFQMSTDSTLDPGMYNTGYNSGIRLYCGTVLSSSWPTTETYQFKTVCIDQVGIINLGDPNVFPFIDVERTRTADGTQTGFNFGIAELDDYVEVYIDGVLQNSSTYTWNKKDYTCFQAYESYDGEYLKELGNWNGGWNTAVGPYFRYAESIGGDPYPSIMSDFGRVLTLRKSKSTGGGGTATMQYSVDGTNWSSITVQAGEHTIDPPIQARYMKDNYAFQNYSIYYVGLGQGIDQLVFNTAPPAGAVVKIKSKSPYPMKDENWIIQSMAFDIYLNKAT